MKIAIATENGQVATHFGRCPEYTLAEVTGPDVSGRVTIPNPGHEPGFLPRYLAGLGVEVIIAGGMGPRAQGLFASQGIETLVGVCCSVDEAIRGFADGTLEPGESSCDHGDGHGHGDHTCGRQC